MSGTSAVQAVFNAGAAVVSTLALGPGDRGLMVIGMLIGSLSALVGGLGTGPAFRFRLCAVSGEDRRALLSAFVWCSAVGGVFAAALSVVGTARSAPLIDDELATPGFLVAVGAFTIVQVVVQQVVEAWFADGRFRRGATAAALVSAGGLLGVVIASVTARTTTGLLTGQAIAAAAVLIVEVVALRRAGLLELARPSREDVVALLRRGGPTLGLAVGLVVALRADRYVLGLTSGPAAVGVYSLAATLSEVARMIPSAIGQIYLRDVSLGRGGRNLTKAIGAAVAAAALGGLLITAAAWVLVVPVFGAEFGAARVLLVVLVVAELCFAPYAVASRGLLGGGWSKTAGALGGCGAIGAITCYCVSGSLAGAAGVAAGSVVVYGALSIASWTLLRRRIVVASARPGG